VYVKAVWNQKSSSLRDSLSKEGSRKFFQAFSEIALSANTQYQFLQLVVQLPEETQDKIEETKLARPKATCDPLTLLG
jgi:hypothetical protein